MKNNSEDTIVISAVGVVSSIGNTTETFWQSLLAGKSNFALLERRGRGEQKFIGAELQDFVPPPQLKQQRIRDACLSAQVAVCVIEQAMQQAKLKNDCAQTGLIIGGTNIAQREQRLMWQKYQERPNFIRPSYARNFLDTDICGVCTQIFGIRGFAYTIGGASSSGQLAVIQAVNAVKLKQVETCIAVGALIDLSELELQAFQSVGAMVSKEQCSSPQQGCCPFDQGHQGFVYGENCAALVIETEQSARKRGATPLVKITGTAITMDANRETNPSLDGEIKAMQKALVQANWGASTIDYVNPHGTGSIMGDETELKALREVGLTHAYINTTKSITGHGLTAAGAVEIAATVLQLQHQQLHPSRNLQNPTAKDFHWVKDKPLLQEVRRAISISLGFGGINTAVCLERYTS